MKTGRFSEGEQGLFGVGRSRHTGKMAIEISAKELLELRLHSQRLARVDVASGAPRGDAVSAVVDTVRHLLAIQAQDFAQSLWAIGVRTPGSVRADVLAALASGAVVRSLPMRGTLHFVPAEDLGWMLRLTSARTLQGASTRFRNLGLEQGDLDRAESLVRKELAGGGSLSRDEFMKMLEANGISPEGQRGYHVIFYLSQIQLVCWGPPRGTQQALVLVDEWVRKPRLLDRDDALREFALRYFSGHGPATLKDYAWWTKLTLKDARAAIDAASGELTEVVLRTNTADNHYWIGASGMAAAPSSAGAPAVVALPGFDEYLLGYQDRSLALAAEHSDLIVPGSNGIFLPIIVARGKVVGTWRRGRKGATIEPDHFVEASQAQLTAFAREARRYARFAG
jgi:hypothetical protein